MRIVIIDNKMRIRREKMDPFSKVRKMRIMIVDDDEFIRDFVNLAFKDKGCLLLATETAEERPQALIKEGFGIITSDFQLPGNGRLNELVPETKTAC